MWDVIKSIFSVKTVDSVISGIDKSVFTDQERVELHVKMLGQYSAYKLAQRVLAFVVVIPFVFLVLMSAGFLIYSAFTVNNDVYDLSLELMTFASKNLGQEASIILLFYFGGGAIESLKKRREDG